MTFEEAERVALWLGRDQAISGIGHSGDGYGVWLTNGDYLDAMPAAFTEGSPEHRQPEGSPQVPEPTVSD